MEGTLGAFLVAVSCGGCLPSEPIIGSIHIVGSTTSKSCRSAAMLPKKRVNICLSLTDLTIERLEDFLALLTTALFHRVGILLNALGELGALSSTQSQDNAVRNAHGRSGQQQAAGEFGGGSHGGDLGFGLGVRSSTGDGR